MVKDVILDDASFFLLLKMQLKVEGQVINLMNYIITHVDGLAL